MERSETGQQVESSVDRDTGNRDGLKALLSRKDAIRLAAPDRSLLQEIIQGDVAFMTAAKLSAVPGNGIENDRLYRKPLRAFEQLVLAEGTRLADLKRFMENELPQGRPVYLKVLFLEAAVRRLGEKWVADDCDFIDVTIGTARMQQLLHALSPVFRRAGARVNAPRALIITPPREQHTMMSYLLGLLFESLGWSRRICNGDVSGRELEGEILASDIVCISWSHERLRAEVAEIVRRVRLAQDARHIPVVMGGAAALSSVEFLVGLGVDCVCDSVYSAASVCEHYIILSRSDNAERNGSARLTSQKTRKIGWSDDRA